VPAVLRLARHDAAAQASYQELKRLARTQARVLTGTPGTLKPRTQSGRRYWVREHIRADGGKVDEYLGAESALQGGKLDAARAGVELARALAAGSSRLRLFGYQRVERHAAAVLAVLFNRGLFGAGLVLVGSHAYGALLNELGVAAPGYRTRDVDVARSGPLAIALPADASFGDLLRETGLAFHPVPAIPADKPSASFKLRGAEGLAVDLLVPGRRAGDIVPADDLHAHAQTVPLLAFLVSEPVDAAVLSPNQVVPVKVPSPERFVLHKLYSSQSRRADRDKVRKDLQQAALLAAAVEEDMPGALRGAFRRVPAEGRTAVRRGASAAARLLGEADTPGLAVLRAIGRG
jgi:hypothetical protein